jgi:hypothetical protein
MTRHTDSNSILHRVLSTVRRTWTDMERINRAMLEVKPTPRRR